MADLIAQGPEPDQRWRRPLPTDELVLLGRTASLATGWDAAISREHAQLLWRDGQLRVRCLKEARNPIYYRGRARDRFDLSPGGRFVIGKTTFTLTDERAEATLDAPPPEIQESYSSAYLKRFRYRHAEQRIEALNRLPELIASAASDAELFSRIVNVLFSGIAIAHSAAVVRCGGPPAETADKDHVDVLHWDRRRLSGDSFAPSQRLIQTAVEHRESVLHVWKANQQSQFTQRDEADWAFCTPLTNAACAGWALYIEGRFAEQEAVATGSGPVDLREELKFAELVATTVGSLRENRMLEQRQAGLRQFFSPIVLEALSRGSPDEALAPREAEVSVMFCDLRGFSRTSEEAADDLMGLLNRVSKALGVTTRHILDHGGVVGDFQGDAVMGFWGWPLPQHDKVLRACQAALCIRAEFAAAARRAGHPLAGFNIGVGIATGTAVAGKIGTVDQVKVTVFGPVANLASRMEGMTKFLRAGIIIDEATAELVREQVSAQLMRLRRLAVVQPYGMVSRHAIYELLPAASDEEAPSDESIAQYEAAWQSMAAGDWEAAHSQLHDVPATDEVKDFLTAIIAQHGRRPPSDWDGVIKLANK
ncbi:MAG: adenylate/guanylate cyclase domain-containing protein [Pirellulales bacterium]